MAGNFYTPSPPFLPAPQSSSSTQNFFIYYPHIQGRKNKANKMFELNEPIHGLKRLEFLHDNNCPTQKVKL